MTYHQLFEHIHRALPQFWVRSPTSKSEHKCPPTVSIASRCDCAMNVPPRSNREAQSHSRASTPKVEDAPIQLFIHFRSTKRTTPSFDSFFPYLFLYTVIYRILFHSSSAKLSRCRITRTSFTSEKRLSTKVESIEVEKSDQGLVNEPRNLPNELFQIKMENEFLRAALEARQSSHAEVMGSLNKTKELLRESGSKTSQLLAENNALTNLLIRLENDEKPEGHTVADPLDDEDTAFVGDVYIAGLTTDTVSLFRTMTIIDADDFSFDSSYMNDLKAEEDTLKSNVCEFEPVPYEKGIATGMALEAAPNMSQCFAARSISISELTFTEDDDVEMSNEITAEGLEGLLRGRDALQSTLVTEQERIAACDQSLDYAFERATTLIDVLNTEMEFAYCDSSSPCEGNQSGSDENDRTTDALLRQLQELMDLKGELVLSVQRMIQCVSSVPELDCGVSIIDGFDDTINYYYPWNSDEEADSPRNVIEQRYATSKIPDSPCHTVDTTLSDPFCETRSSFPDASTRLWHETCDDSSTTSTIASEIFLDGKPSASSIHCDNIILLRKHQSYDLEDAFTALLQGEMIFAEDDYSTGSYSEIDPADPLESSRRFFCASPSDSQQDTRLSLNCEVSTFSQETEQSVTKTKSNTSQPFVIPAHRQNFSPLSLAKIFGRKTYLSSSTVKFTQTGSRINSRPPKCGKNRTKVVSTGPASLAPRRLHNWHAKEHIRNVHKCTQKNCCWHPHLHKRRAPCERCWTLASQSDKKSFFENGWRHLRINSVKGGCLATCTLFNRSGTDEVCSDEDVRLCRSCFDIMHHVGIRSAISGSGFSGTYLREETPASFDS